MAAESILNFKTTGFTRLCDGFVFVTNDLDAFEVLREFEKQQLLNTAFITVKVITAKLVLVGMFIQRCRNGFKVSGGRVELDSPSPILHVNIQSHNAQTHLPMGPHLKFPGLCVHYLCRESETRAARFYL